MPNLASELRPVVNQRLTEVEASGIRAFDQKISKIPGIVKLTIGEPDLNTPEHIKAAAVTSIVQNDSHYSAQRGTLALRNAISGYLERSQELTYDPETEIVVTVGATEALTATTFALLNPGDKVIVPTPTFALYFPIISLTGAIPVMVDTSADQFVLTPERLTEVLEREGDAVKAVLLNYPSNPTGVEYDVETVKGLAQVIREHHLYAISDEIYAELTYDFDHYSIAKEIPERTILVNGLSKSHAMTGYRIGYVAAPAEVVANITKMHAFMVTAPSNPAQAAAAEALANGDADPVEAKESYRRRRDFIRDALMAMGIETVAPQGAFYIFARIPAAYGQDDVKFAEELAAKALVGGTPGSAFGAGGEGYIRFSYAASDESLKLAMTRMSEFVGTEIGVH
ncbi:aminotransferase class I/II-fold pyridoxal phosphate-dependent enzyme [Secundilactobacillus oryzae]|nr:aminotransferase class I/II-fold pyridoxal phosphate-dependent enzyme [Secundilactobacillus oryzae]